MKSCIFAPVIKEKPCKSLTYRTLSNALQDGHGFKKMKSLEIFRNYKKLKTQAVTCVVWKVLKS